MDDAVAKFGSHKQCVTVPHRFEERKEKPPFRT
jgi:hypothetical protein